MPVTLVLASSRRGTLWGPEYGAGNASCFWVMTVPWAWIENCSTAPAGWSGAPGPGASGGRGSMPGEGLVAPDRGGAVATGAVVADGVAGG